jgi:hypothetical protein
VSPVLATIKSQLKAAILVISIVVCSMLLL